MNGQLQWNKLRGFLGGSFDPPHLGHRKIAEELTNGKFGIQFQSLHILPSSDPPQKNASPYFHRLAMCQRNFQSIDHVSVDELEQKKGFRFTHETLTYLSSQLKEFAFVIGSDQVENFSTWKHFPEILSLCHWIVLARKPDGMRLGREKLQAFQKEGLIQSKEEHVWSVGSHLIQLVETDAPSLCSTVIRQKIFETGSIPENDLYSPVANYLKENHLYGYKVQGFKESSLSHESSP